MASKIDVDPIKSESDRADAISLLSEGFPKEQWWPEVIGNFNLNERARGGLLLKIDGTSQGVMLLFEHERLVHNKSARFVNIASWYVREQFRSFTMAMLARAIEDEQAYYSIFTPSAAVVKRCLAAGFRLTSNGAILSLPFRNDRGTGRRTSIRVIKPEANYRLESTTFGPLAAHDHSRPPFVALEVADARRDALAVVIFRVIARRGIRFARLMYTNNADLVVASLAAVKYFLLRRNWCFGIYLPNSPPYNALINNFPNIGSPSIVVKGPLSDVDFDLLYSEYLYLPI